MHFIGPQAGEVIQGYAAAVKYVNNNVYNNIMGFNLCNFCFIQSWINF